MLGKVWGGLLSLPRALLREMPGKFGHLWSQQWSISSPFLIMSVQRLETRVFARLLFVPPSPLQTSAHCSGTGNESTQKSYTVRHFLQSVYPLCIWWKACDQISQAFPLQLHIWILQEKTGTGKGLAVRLKDTCSCLSFTSGVAMTSATSRR